MSIAPYGGKLVYRVIAPENAQEKKQEAEGYPKIQLRQDSVTDVQNLAYGLFSPLEGFQGKADYESVLSRKRLKSGLPWTIPITLDAPENEADSLEEGKPVALTGPDGTIIAVLHLQERFSYDQTELAQQVFRTTDREHPGVAKVFEMSPVLLSGAVDLIEVPTDPFLRWNLSPAETRVLFKERGWKNIVAFQTRNPVHRAHEYLIKCALETVDAVLLHPLVGQTKDDDIDAGVRMRCYQVLLDNYFPQDRIALSVMPVNMRYAGPSEAIFHAIIRRNYGCSHFIVGRDHAGVGNYYGTYDAQEIFDEFEASELEITPMRFEHSFFCHGCGGMATAKTCPHGNDQHVFLSGTKVRQLLEAGEAPPAEFTRSEVAEVLLSSVKDGDSVGPLRGEVEGLSGYLDPSQESQVKDRLAARGYL